MTLKKPITAGARLRADLDAALAAASTEVGRQLEFDEGELITLTQAVAAADRAEELQRLYDAELTRSPESRPRTVVALAAELRLTEKAVVDLVARISLGLGAAKSPRHVRAARTRWTNVEQSTPRRPA